MKTELIQAKNEVPSHVTPPWWNDDFTNEYTNQCRSVVKRFVDGNLIGLQTASKNPGRHKYESRNNGTELWLFKDNPTNKVWFCVAKVVNGTILGNASSLAVIKNLRTGELTPLNWGTLKIQEVLQDVFTMVPFRLFEDAGLDIDTFQTIEKGPEELVKVARIQDPQERHFTGAIVFTLRNTGGELAYYLFDLDRNDVALKTWNPFLSKLPNPVTSIADAYDSLKPQEIKDAERFLGKPCPRQGEWFFIPSKEDHKDSGNPAVLRNPGTRDHEVEVLSEDGFVKGRVTHRGWEHAAIILRGWHKPVGNGAVESFKISGAID